MGARTADDGKHMARHVSEITTDWQLLDLAGGRRRTDPEGTREARDLICRRYYEPTRRYAHAIFRGHPDADDFATQCTDDLIMMILKGGFDRADPEKGRFRDYYKTALGRYVKRFLADERRAARFESLAQFADRGDVPDREAGDSFDAGFARIIIDRALATLKDDHQRILRERERLDHLKLEEFATAMGMTYGTLRSRLAAAKKSFARAIRREVRAEFGNPTEEDVDEELAYLGILKFLREEAPPPGDSQGRLQDA